MLENEEQYVIGWSIENDVRYVFYACKRYNKDQIKYRYFDLQKILMALHNTTQQISLETACNEYNIKLSNSHKSDDDAKMTMQVCKAICESLNLSIEELLLKYKDTVSDTVDEFEKRDVEYTSKVKYKKATRDISFALSHYEKKENNKNSVVRKNKIYCFSPELEVNYTNKIIDMSKIIINCGGKITSIVSECDYFIRDEKIECSRLKMAQKRKVKIIPFNKFKGRLYKYNKVKAANH